MNQKHIFCIRWSTRGGTVLPVLLLAYVSISQSMTPDLTNRKHLRVIGGVKATEGEFPFIVSLQMKPVFGPSYHYCSGLIYHSSSIYTAAHCVKDRDFTQIQVVAGANDLTNPDEPSVQRRNISEVFINAEYDPMTLSNDVAVLLLESPLELNSRVKIAPMPPPELPLPEYAGNCTIAGWGSNLGGDLSAPQVLQKLNMTIVSLSTCQSIYQYIRPINASTMICARGENVDKTQGPCTGDSAVPLICLETSTNRSVAAGIMSWSMTPCGDSSYPSVYTNLQPFI